jgi:hypothetical protein
MTGLRFPAAKLSEEKQVTPSTSPLSTFANLIPNWVQGIFGSSEPMADSASVDLEAYIAEPTTASAPVKIPLGHERLKFGLSRVQKNKKGSTWFRYMDMNSVQRGIVDEVVKFAKTQSHHVRTCIAVEEFKREGHPRSYLIFFSLAEPPKSVSLKDAVGRQFSFPYELCRDWEVRIFSLFYPSHRSSPLGTVLTPPFNRACIDSSTKPSCMSKSLARTSTRATTIS